MTVDIVIIVQILQLLLVLFIFYNLLTFKENKTNYYLQLITILVVLQMVVPPLFRRYLNAADNMNIK